MSPNPSIIAVPIDFHEASLRALELAKELAPVYDARIVLLHVCTIPVYAYPGLAPMLMQGLNEDVLNAAKKATAELAEKHGGLEVVVRDGDAATEILDFVKERSPKLVVMGTHGRRGLTHLLLGSVAEKIVRQCPVPVMTVRIPEA
jgi:nucleotide-binding universal stress UspA family protein